MAITKIYDLANAILASVATRLAAEGVDVPERQFVHAGELALDGVVCCETLAVTGLDLVHAIPGESPAILTGCFPPRTVHLDVWLIRCVPVSSLDAPFPSPADLDAAAERILTDLYALPTTLAEGFKAGDWPPGLGCGNVMLDQVTVYGPEGGCSGAHADLYVQLL